MGAFNLQNQHARSSARILAGHPEMMAKQMWSGASVGVCCELPGEFVPAALVMEEEWRRAPERQREGDLLGKGDVGAPWRAGVAAGGGGRGSP